MVLIWISFVLPLVPLADLAEGFKEWFLPFVPRVCTLVDLSLDCCASFWTNELNSPLTPSVFDLLPSLLAIQGVKDSCQQELWSHIEEDIGRLIPSQPGAFLIQARIFDTFAKCQQLPFVDVTLDSAQILVSRMLKSFPCESRLPRQARYQARCLGVRDDGFKDYMLNLEACSKLLQLEFIRFGPQLLDEDIHELLCLLETTAENSLVIAAVREKAQEILDSAEQFS